MSLVSGSVSLASTLPVVKLVSSSVTKPVPLSLLAVGRSFCGNTLIVKTRVEDDVSLLVTRTMMLWLVAFSKSSRLPSATVTTPVVAWMAKRPPASSVSM